MEFDNEKLAVLITKKRKREKMECIELPKSGKYQNILRKRKLQVLVNIVSWHSNGDERKK